MFKKNHPSPSGGRRVFKGKDLPDNKGVKGNESRWVFCRHCGFPVDTEVHPRGEWGDPNSFTYTTASYTHPVVSLKAGSPTWGSATTYYWGDPTGHGGCPFCHSKDY